jgi:hypothetical protein
MSLEGAKQVEGDEIGPLIDEYFISSMYGPANDFYEPGNNNAAQTLSDYPGINRTGEVRAPPNNRVENTTSR